MTEPARDSSNTKVLMFDLLVLGVTTVLPWNFFMSAYDYYKYKLSIVDTSNNDDNYTTDGCNAVQSACDEKLNYYVGIKLDHYENCYCPEEDNENNTVYYRNVTINDDLISQWREDFQEGNNISSSNSIPDFNNGRVANKYVDFWSSTFSVITMVMMLLSSIFVNWNYIQRTTTKTLRINTSLKALKVLIVLNILLIYIPLSSTVFFLISVSLILLINMSSGIYQTTVFQVAAVYPPKFFNFFLQGQSIGGILANILALVCGFLVDLIYSGSSNNCDSSGSKTQLLAILFFGVATATVFYCQIRFNVMYKESHQRKSVCFDSNEGTPLKKAGSSENVENGQNVSLVNQNVVSSWSIIRRSIWHLLSVFLCFTVTLSVFPSVVTEIRPRTMAFMHSKDHCQIDQFNPLFFKFNILLMFNLGDYLGRFIPEYTKLGMTKDNSWWYCPLIALSRFIFILLFFSCNLDGDGVGINGLEFMNKDISATLLVLLLGVTNGYLCSLSLQFAALQFEPEETMAKAKIGGYSTTILTLGLLCGSLLSYKFVQIAKDRQEIAEESALDIQIEEVIKQCIKQCGHIISRQDTGPSEKDYEANYAY